MSHRVKPKKEYSARPFTPPAVNHNSGERYIMSIDRATDASNVQILFPNRESLANFITVGMKPALEQHGFEVTLKDVAKKEQKMSPRAL